MPRNLSGMELAVLLRRRYGYDFIRQQFEDVQAGFPEDGGCTLKDLKLPRTSLFF